MEVTLARVVMVMVATPCFIDWAAAQHQVPLGKTAYTQLMSQCLGETSYRKYLESVARTQQECGGDPNEPVFFSASLFHTGAPVHFQAGIPFSPLVQGGIGGLQVQPGVLTQPRTQLPGLLPQQLGGFPSQVGILPQHAGILKQQQQPPGAFFQQPHLITQQPGAFTSQPGTFPQESGISSSLLDSRSRTTPLIITDSLPSLSSPVGPNYPGIRQKRQVAVSLADINEIRDKIRMRINNFTCVLTKLNVINSNLDLNHHGLLNSVVDLPVRRELKRDLLRAISYCRDMMQCLPLEKQNLSVPHKLKRVMEYVKCEKEMRLLACHKHDIRQNLQGLNLRRLFHGTGQLNSVEEVVDILVDAQSAHELDLI